MFYVQFVFIVLIDTAAEDESEDLVPIKPVWIPSSYNWPSEGGILNAVSFVLCSVLFIFQMFKYFNFNTSVCPIYLIQ